MAGHRIITLRVEGMSCGGCVSRVRQVLCAVPGVHDAAVNLATHSAVVTAAAETSFEDIASQLKGHGYDATVLPPEVGATPQQREYRQQLRQGRQALVQALFMWAPPVLALEILGPALGSADPGSEVWWRALQAVLCGLALYSPAGGPILYGGLRALLFRAPNMDLLISVGLVAAYLSSVAAIFLPAATHYHFHAVVMILAFIDVGRYLETKARHQVVEAVGALAGHAPRRVLKVVGDETVELPVEAVQPGDRLRVAADQVIPVDGRVVQGQAAVDESMLTGEALPVARGVGDEVSGGTLVVNGMLILAATSLGRDSAIGRIQAAVQQAQSGRTRMQRIADRVAGVFVSVVVLLALVTLAAWGLAGGQWSRGIACGVAVLVIACPCALGLATPTAVYIATARAALRGILVKDAAALERLGSVRTVVFDKTGTLTRGHPTVAEVRVLGGRAADPHGVLGWAASIEQYSSHPLARAIVAHARQKGVEPRAAAAFDQEPGRGARGDLDGDTIRVGSAAYLHDAGIDTAPFEADLAALTAGGQTLVWVACGSRAVGVLGLTDTLREDAAAALQMLGRLGVSSALVSGDREAAARAVADALGVEQVAAGLSPQDKAAFVGALREQGRSSAFVGDGTNDAPALAEADCGVALATGTELANITADINLVSDRLARVPDAIALARRARRVIWQNLLWALGYNVLAIPLAAVGAVPHWLAPAAMMCSSLAVVLNSLRLRTAP